MLTNNTVTLDGGRRQVVYRAGEGPPLVWLHSLYGVEFDAPLIERLAQRHSVYAPVAPGFADLDELDDLRDIHDLALHYDDLLEQLRLEQVVLAGHSFGAMVAAEIVAHAPHRASHVVLLSPLGLWHDDYPVADLFGVPPADVPALLYADSTRVPGGGGESKSTTQTDVETVISLVRGMTTVARFLWPIPDRGLARRLYRVRAPTLVVHGEQDRFVPVEYADQFVARLPHGTRRLIPNAGHMLPVEALDQVIATIDEFLVAPAEVLV